MTPSAASALATPRPGRPRDPVRHEAILAATRTLILEAGYSRVTFEAVAARAGVSRMTIHKWWRHRVELVEEALFTDSQKFPPPNSGSFEKDLKTLVDEMVSRMTQPVLVLGMPPLRAELNAHPELMKSTASLYEVPNERRWKDVFARAARRGEIHRSADAVAAMHIVLGSIEALSQAQPEIVSRKKMGAYLLTVLLGGISGPTPRRSRKKVAHD
ncbi:MAG: TetR/AcrR family transcriptional regulator [Myxococcota bacterium]